MTTGQEASTSGLEDAIVEAQLVDTARSRAPRGLDGRDRWISAAGAGAFTAAATALAVYSDQPFDTPPLIAITIVLVYAAVSRVEFELGSGSLVPTQLVLVPMLFLLPPAFVPLAVATGLLLGSLVDQARGRLHVERSLVVLLYSHHCLGPAVVFVVAGVDAPRWSDWPVYAVALASQFLLDAATVLAREVGALRVSLRALQGVLPRVYAMDALLSPVGLLAAFAAQAAPAAFLAVVPLALLFHLFAVDRRVRIDQTVELSGAFAEVSRVARTDALTGLANRLAWEEALDRAVAARSREPISVVLVDVDSLKATNDRFGHDIGDRLIQEVASTTAAVLGGGRRLVARIGGDELGCLLPGIGERDCARLVAKLEQAISAHRGFANLTELSASVGTASCPPERSIGAAVEQADRRAYEAKRRRGRARAAASDAA